MSNKSFSESFAKAVRVITVSPIMAFILFTVLHFLMPGAFIGIRYFAAVLCVCIIPALSYAVCSSVPTLKQKGRAAERTLALAFSLAGYAAGFLWALLGSFAQIDQVVLLVYLLSGLSLAIMQLLFHKKGSGHMCGVSGPIAMSVHCLGPIWLAGALLLVPTAWASLKLKRHTWQELLRGWVVPVAAQGIAFLLLG